MLYFIIVISYLDNKIKNINHYTVETVLTPDRKIVQREKIDNTQISWLGTGTSIKTKVYYIIPVSWLIRYQVFANFRLIAIKL